jgi:hypothetical protein
MMRLKIAFKVFAAKNLVVGEHILPSMNTEMLFRKGPIGL